MGFRLAQRIRWTPLGVVPLLVALLASCSSHSAARTANGSHARLAVTALSPDLVSAYFPVSGAEPDQPSAVRALFDEVRQNALSACTKAEGFRVPGFQGEAPIHLATMPDLNFIRAHGFNIVSHVDVGENLTTAPPAKWQAFERAFQHCGAVADASVSRFTTTVLPLASQWMTTADSVQDDPAVVRAYAGFVTCLHKAGVNVADEMGFFGYVDGLHNDQAQYEVASKVYLPCITPVEKVRLPLRESLRATFFNDHASELRAAQQAANDLARRYAGTYASYQASPPAVP